jgi:PIN domain nuclease of toxin-antitoxin system
MTRILFDTHVYFWWITDDPKLPRASRDLLEDADEPLLSSVVPWELATKGRLGKWPSALRVLEEIDDLLVAGAFVPLPINARHARVAGLFAADHRDPFDRILAAQAKCEAVPLMSADRAFRRFDIDVLW